LGYGFFLAALHIIYSKIWAARGRCFLYQHIGFLGIFRLFLSPLGHFDPSTHIPRNNELQLSDYEDIVSPEVRHSFPPPGPFSVNITYPFSPYVQRASDRTSHDGSLSRRINLQYTSKTFNDLFQLFFPGRIGFWRIWFLAACCGVVIGGFCKYFFPRLCCSFEIVFGQVGCHFGGFVSHKKSSFFRPLFFFLLISVYHSVLE
jgi:hypothetical protein